MGLPEKQTRFSLEDYLEGEKTSTIRHEYVDGQIYAKTGDSADHNQLTLSLAAKLYAHLADGACRVFASDMKVLTPQEISYYPDVMVCCDPTDRESHLRRRPRLLIEIVSPHTQRTDHYEKRLAYQQIPTLQEYIIVAQDKILVDIFRRQEDGHWIRETLTQGDDDWRLDSVQLTLRLADVYRNVEFSPLADSPNH
jgi:Uma2 family endonuclease